MTAVAVRQAPLHTWVSQPLPEPVRRAAARLRKLDDVQHVALMPDVHLAGDVCIGTVLATSRLIYPEAVGGDIGCGMAAIRLDGAVDRLERAQAAQILAGLGRAVPIARHASEGARLPASLAEAPLSQPALRKLVRGIGRVQFATLGRGNHFVELQRASEHGSDDAIWLMVHSGSRGIGQAIRDCHVARASELSGPRGRGLARLDADTPEGAAYLDDMAWALAYAAASRHAMIAAASEVVGAVLGVAAEPATLVDCHHNFVRRETHDGRALWVHRKGAISAQPGEPGIIPGSMGSASFHVTGRGHGPSLCSSSHGAGRVMSRAEARRRISVKALRQQLDGVWFDERMASRLRDEAPGAYKDIGAVMRAQRALTRIERRLTPLLSYKGG